MSEKGKEAGPGPGDIVDAIERFFLDLIGTVIPGGLLLIGWALLFGLPRIPHLEVFSSVQLQAWLFLAVAYVTGHFVTGLGILIVGVGESAPVTKLLQWMRLPKLTSFVQVDVRVTGKISKTPAFLGFVERALLQVPGTSAKASVRSWRNVAMTLLTPEQTHLIYRFMFISLLNLGAATVCFILIAAWTLAMAASRLHLMADWGSLLFTTVRPLDPPVLIAGIVVAFVFFERRHTFYERALSLPFPMALVKLADVKLHAGTVSSTASAKPTLYLAGGTRSNWQDSLVAALPKWRIIDPRTHKLKDEREYTVWDLEGIRRSDWIIAYLEATNPGGYNLALEIGYARACGKRIILVDDKSASDEQVSRYTGMLRAAADTTPATVDEAIAFLRSLPIDQA